MSVEFQNAQKSFDGAKLQGRWDNEHSLCTEYFSSQIRVIFMFISVLVHFGPLLREMYRPCLVPNHMFYPIYFFREISILRIVNWKTFIIERILFLIDWSSSNLKNRLWFIEFCSAVWHPFCMIPQIIWDLWMYETSLIPCNIHTCIE